ncbi:uncharacterized protein PG998_001571 [Apiospora kogelbergensis]|uniref:uncharacterized protein n=1 Tax=Apiospora kogelbergensis TaxID=1337665 RepID=UPI00312D14E1
MADLTGPQGKENAVIIKDNALALLNENREPHVRAYTSPRLLRDLTAGALLIECNGTGDNVHELFLISSQCGDVASALDTCTISCVCANCRKHFHVTYRNERTSEENFATIHPNGIHVFVLYQRKNRNDFRQENQYKHSFPVGETKLVCAVEGCYCCVDIVALNPVLTNSDLDNFQDTDRVRRNLAVARRDDPDRFHDTPDQFGDNALGVFLKYIRDGLESSSGQRRIRKRNKKFMVCFGGDFDPLFRSLGFKETSDLNAETGELEESWLFPEMDQATSFTRFDTQRAKWEDASAELRASLQRRGRTFEGAALQQAWNRLSARIRVHYEPVTIPVGHPKDDDKDYDLLGCWTDYKAVLFAGVAILLAKSCPGRAIEFYTAARNIIGKRTWDGTCWDSATELASHESLHTASLEYTQSQGMKPQDAANLLGVELQYPAELVQEFVNNVAADLAKDPAKKEKATKAIEALQTLANYKRNDSGAASGETEARKLESLAGVFQSYTGDESHEWFGMPGLEETQSAEQHAGFKNTPPGLHNIGNTCYLNSLLQYLYNVKPIRDLVLHHDQDRPELTPENVEARRIGGTGESFTLDEAIVARQFMESLAQLFVDLQTTKEVSAQPSQKLANTALKSASALLVPKQQTEPPPLPARPSPAAPAETQQDVDMVNVSVEPLADTNDVTSSMSSQTLINDSEATSMGSYVEVNVPSKTDDQAEMGGEGEESPKASHVEIKPEIPVLSQETTLEEKYQVISERLEQSDRKGTNQNDVGEIVGNVLEHLMRSIKSDGPVPGRSDLQSDKITRTFFPMFVNYSHRLDVNSDSVTESKEVIPDRWLSAFPTAQKATVYQSLPPILHIYIQRTGSTKNRNPVLIEDVLYMDRYMEADSDSELASRRRRAALLKMRLSHFGSHSKEEPSLNKTSTPANLSLPSGDEAARCIDPSKLSWEDLLTFSPANDQPTVETMKSLKRKAEGSPPHSVQDQKTRDAEELKVLQAELDQLFNDNKSEKYLLHAIICHGGGVTAGHYWVWIRDFKKDVWLKYNDSTVTEDSRDSQAVLDELNSSGDPYYLAYVREDARDEMVDVPQRAVAPDDSDEAHVAPPEHAIKMETIEGWNLPRS